MQPRAVWDNVAERKRHQISTHNKAIDGAASHEAAQKSRTRRIAHIQDDQAPAPAFHFTAAPGVDAGGQVGTLPDHSDLFSFPWRPKPSNSNRLGRVRHLQYRESPFANGHERVVVRDSQGQGWPARKPRPGTDPFQQFGSAPRVPPAAAQVEGH
jgi:hypothetical protein